MSLIKHRQDMEKSFSVTSEDARVQAEPFWSLMERQPYGHVTEILDPVETLCPDAGKCLYHDAEMSPYYYDDHHLTMTGAKLLAAQIHTLFDMIANDQRLAIKDPKE